MNMFENITQDQVDGIIKQTTRSPAQKASVTKAFSLLQDIVLTGEAQDTQALRVPKVTTPVVVFVVSGNKSLPKRTIGKVEHRAETQLCVASIQAAQERHGAVTVVTFGNFGAEFTAQRFAKGQGIPTLEVAPVWNVPQPDGSTVRNGQALKDRDAILKAMVEAAEVPIVLAFGEGSSDYAKVKHIFATLAKAGAHHKGNPVPVTAEQDVAYITEQAAQEKADGFVPDEVDPGAEAAGQPDVPVSS